MFFNHLKSGLLRTVQSSDCYLCHSPIKTASTQAHLICDACHQDLAHLFNCCRVCSLPLTSDRNSTCGQCLTHSPLFTQTVAAYHYERPISDFITQFKFTGKREPLDFMCQDLTTRIKQVYRTQILPQLIIPVPLHDKRLRQRGFNQAYLIAQKLSQRLDIKIDNQIATRTRNTLSQVDLDASQRIKNLRDAFKVAAIPELDVAIVDDVVTTGTTANELARNLIRAGAKRVDIWCLARAYNS